MNTQPHAHTHATSDSDQPGPLLVTIPQAARILSIGRSAFYQLIWNGEIRPIHIGRSIRVSIDELHRFVETRVTT